MAECGNMTIGLKPAAELTALVDRLANLVGRFDGCTIRVLSLQPGDVIVLESSQRLSERAYEHLAKQANEQWPNNRFVILDSCKFSGVTRDEPVPLPDREKEKTPVLLVGGPCDGQVVAAGPEAPGIKAPYWDEGQWKPATYKIESAPEGRRGIYED